ncbi:hypothetical protein FXO37_29706 [Capsicum annuum]|nr:hypothetical protein FXO37_29706 [Capsicum annuum]
MVEVYATYDSKTFVSMGYVLVDSEWCKKDSSKTRSDTSKVSKSMSNPVLSATKEIQELKEWLKAIKKGLVDLWQSTTRLIQLSKKMSTDMDKVRLSLDDLKLKDVKMFNRLFARVDTIKSKTSSSNNELAISVQNFYSSFTKKVEKSYEHFCTNMHNTLTYFLEKGDFS